VDIGGTYNGITKLVIAAEIVAWKANMRAAADRLGTPLWIGELGAMSLRTEGVQDFTRDWLTMTEDMRIGWTYWSSDPSHTDPTGTEQSVSPIDPDGRLTTVGEVLVRPYPRAVAGTPTKISYVNGRLTVGWHNRAGVSGPTELWLPAAAFPGTPKVSSTDAAGRWRTRWDADSRVLQVWADPKRPEHTITVSAGTTL
jgi:endoglycosylceramidase